MSIEYVSSELLIFFGDRCGCELEKLQIYKEDQIKELEEKKEEWIDMVKSVAESHQKIEDHVYRHRMPPVDYVISKILNIVSKLIDPK
jgi:hypothetical protein